MDILIPREVNKMDYEVWIANGNVYLSLIATFRYFRDAKQYALTARNRKRYDCVVRTRATTRELYRARRIK